MVGVALSLVGLVLVLDVLGGVRVDGLGVLFGLVAACGLASFFLLSGNDDEDSLPPIVLAGGGLVAAAVTFAVLGAAGVLPMAFPSTSVRIAGASFPWWVAVLELAVIAAATPYVSGIMAARLLGAKLASFVGLSEVMFAVLFAWVLLGELPRPVQLVGGLFILAGVAVVRNERTPQRRSGASRAGSEAEHVPLLGPTSLGEVAVVAHDRVELDGVDVVTAEDQVGVVDPGEAQRPPHLARVP